MNIELDQFHITRACLFQITKYMAALPKEKAPHLTEEGFQYRQKQLIQQLPAHDFNEDYCDDLTDKEKEKMKDFNKKRNEEASGQGAIKEQLDDSGKHWVCSMLLSILFINCCSKHNICHHHDRIMDITVAGGPKLNDHSLT